MDAAPLRNGPRTAFARPWCAVHPERFRIFSLASDALWPWQAHDPDKAARRYLDAIRKARSGL